MYFWIILYSGCFKIIVCYENIFDIFKMFVVVKRTKSWCWMLLWKTYANIYYIDRIIFIWFTDTGHATDENAGWKLPVDQILATTTLPTGVSAGYRVAIVTSSVMAIKEYNGTSWETESLDPYSVIPLKHSGSIQMYLAKASGPVYMGVEYGVFGKFRFMTQAAYDALSSYDNDTIYFVRSS